MAFNQAFADAGLDWHWPVDRYRKLLKVTGGQERIAHYIGEERLPDVDIPALHAAKNAIYSSLVETGQVKLRPGVIRVIEEAQAAGIAIAVATTTSRSNLDSLIAATALSQKSFAAIVTGEDVAKKKPNPEAYDLALQRLSLSAGECIAFEDSENGLLSAHASGVKTVVTPSFYTKSENFQQALLLLPDLDRLGDPSLTMLISELSQVQG